MLRVPREEIGESLHARTGPHAWLAYAAEDKRHASNKRGNGERTPGLSFVLHAHCGMVSPHSHTGVYTYGTKISEQ